MVKTTTKESQDMKEEEKKKMKLKEVDSNEDKDEAEKEFPEKDEETDEAKKKKKSKKEITEDDEDVEKGEEGGENPEEDTASATDANSSTSPNSGVPSKQNVFTPQSSTRVGRESSSGSSAGQSPSEVSYGKSASTDLRKSPLFVEMTKSINGMQDVIASKLSAVEKSFNARIENMQKTLNSVEKFYNSPFYKAAQENVSPEATMKKSIAEQIKDGAVRFR